MSKVAPAPLDEQQRERVSKMVAEARAHLKSFAEAESTWTISKAMDKFGRNEGLYTIMRLAALDANGDGVISDEEMTKFDELGKAVVDGYLGYCTSDGIVSALVLSILWAIPLDNKPEGLAFGEYGDIEWDGQLALSCAAYVIGLLAIACCVLVIGYLACIYHILTFWLPDLTSRLWFCGRLQKFLPTLVSSRLSGFVFGAVSLGLYSLAECGWFGIAAFLPFIAALIPGLHLFVIVQARSITPYLHTQARLMMRVQEA